MKWTVLDLRDSRSQESEVRSQKEKQIPRFARNDRPVRSVMEAVSPLTLWGQDPEGFRPIGPYRGVGPMISPRDLSPTMHARMQQVAYYLYLVNPLAHRIVEYMKNYVVGDGVTVKTEDPAVDRVAQLFWNDPVHCMDLHLPEFVKELSIFGEQCWITAVNPLNGRVRLGHLDPAEIEAVEWGELQVGPETNTAITAPVAVVRRQASGETKPRRLRIVRMDEDPESPTFGYRKGECFYFAINKAHSASRGVSDLFPIGDYLDGYDKMLFGLIDRVGFSNAFIWDVLLKGSTEEKIQEWLKEQKPPRPGSVRVHNEQVEWKAVSPDLKSADFNEAARTIKNMNLAGAGFPEHWFAEGGNVNRAAALEMGEPTLKTLLERQGYVGFMLRQVMEFVVDQAIVAGALPETVDRRFQVQMPELSIRDMARAAQSLAQVSKAVVELRKSRLIDAPTAQKLVASVALQLGVEMNLEDVRTKIEAEEEVSSQKPEVRSQEMEEGASGGDW